MEKGQEEELESKGWRTEKLEAQSCRINSGKGGLSSFNGYYGLACNG